MDKSVPIAEIPGASWVGWLWPTFRRHFRRFVGGLVVAVDIFDSASMEFVPSADISDLFGSVWMRVPLRRYLRLFINGLGPTAGISGSSWVGWLTTPKFSALLGRSSFLPTKFPPRR